MDVELTNLRKRSGKDGRPDVITECSGEDGKYEIDDREKEVEYNGMKLVSSRSAIKLRLFYENMLMPSCHCEPYHERRVTHRPIVYMLADCKTKRDPGAEAPRHSEQRYCSPARS